MILEFMCADFNSKKKVINGLLSLKIVSIMMSSIMTFSAAAINSDQWQIEHMQIEHGLPDSTVYSIAQDQTGFMWFGTTNGLARYDGYSFKTLKHDGADPQTISNNNAGNIFIDSTNTLWVGTFGGGANQLSLTNGELIRHPYSSSQFENMLSENVQTFHEDDDGLIWVGTATGIYRYENNAFTHLDPHAGNTNSTHSRIWDIEGGNEDIIWLGTSDGLLELNRKTETFKHYELPDEMKIDISSSQFRTLFLKDQMLWIGSSSGLFSFNTKQKSFQFHAPNPKSIKVNDIYPAPDGGLLVATMEGLYYYNDQNNTFKTDQDNQFWQPLSHVDVRQIHIDQSNIMWLATRDSGVYKIDLTGGLFQHNTAYQQASQQIEKAKQIWAIESVVNEHVLIGTSDTVFKLKNNQIVDAVSTSSGSSIPGIVRDIESDGQKGHWIASNLGLYYLAVDSNVAETISTPFDLVGIAPADIFSIEVASDGHVWLALYNLGVLRWSPEKNQAIHLKEYNGETFSDLNISHIFEDSMKNIWIGSNLIGVFKLSPDLKQLSHYKHIYNDSKSISSNRIKDIFEDSERRLWIATARGVNQFSYEGDHFEHYSQPEGLIGGEVSFIIEDSHKNLWFGNKFGLSKLNPTNNEVKKYLLNAAIRQDGLITRSVAIGQDDVIYLGSANGYYTFDPKDHKYDIEYQPALSLTSVKIDNRPVQAANLEYQQKQFNLDYNEQLISFDFAVLDYKTPEQVQYSYRLIGLHDDWLDVSTTRRIDFKDLNPGSYQLEIKAINNDGRWQQQTRELEIVVQPVWWEQGWVRALIILAVLLVAIVLHYYRTYKIRKQNIVLEKEVRNRTAELRQLNQQLKRAANSDFLTGLPNRMAFIDNYELKELRGFDSNELCIVMADVDHFKKINDQYGHSAGDEILVELGEIMKQVIRSEDLIARWGGEEFIFCFDNKTADQTLNLIERVRAAIAAETFSYQEQKVEVTMTFGICQKTPEMSLIDCINAADEAMYQGKSSGRNRVVISQ